MAKRKAKELHKYTVPMRVEYAMDVLVEAFDEQEALAKAREMNVLDDGMREASCLSAHVTGTARNAD